VNAPTQTSCKRQSVIALLAGIFLLYGLVGFLLYRGRAVAHLGVFQSDFAIFALPFIAAFFANSGVLLLWKRPESLANVFRHLAVTFAVTVLACVSYMVCAVNIYGE
jgi:hypothetical protein